MYSDLPSSTLFHCCSSPTTFYIRVFVYFPLSFNLDGKYSGLLFQTSGENDSLFSKPASTKELQRGYDRNLLNRTEVLMKMLRRQILVLRMQNMDAGTTGLVNIAEKNREERKETIVSTFTSFSHLFQSIITFLRETSEAKREILST